MSKKCPLNSPGFHLLWWFLRTGEAVFGVELLAAKTCSDRVTLAGLLVSLVFCSGSYCCTVYYNAQLDLLQHFKVISVTNSMPGPFEPGYKV